MTSDNTPSIFDDPPRRTPFDFPHILATVIVTGIGTLIVAGFFLLPQLDVGSEEWINRYNLRLCRQAHSELSALPPDQRLIGHEVRYRLPPNLVIIEMPETEERSRYVLAALTEPDFQIVHTFIPRAISAPLTDGQIHYTIESTEAYLAQVKVSRRRQWIVFLTVWLVAWSFFSWRLLLQAHRRAHGTTP